MTIEFITTYGDYIKQWPNWSGVVPMIGDEILLHFGDNNEREVRYKVRNRVISGTEPDKVVLYIEVNNLTTIR